MPKTFPFVAPDLPSLGRYYFTTDKGLKYEVRFGRKQSDILHANIVFGVLNEEFEGEEYILVNRGEIFSVLQTVEAIIHDFLSKNPNIHGFEFSGEPLDSKTVVTRMTKRTRVYLRYAEKIFPQEKWNICLDENKVFIDRKR